MNIKTKVIAQSICAFRRATLIWLSSAGIAFSSSVCTAQAPMPDSPAPDSPAIEAQARAMLTKLTLEQKIELIGGVDDMFTHAEPAIGLPRFKMSDASVGVRTWGPTHRLRRRCRVSPPPGTPDFARKLGESRSARMPAPAASTSCSAPASTLPARP
jgi:hypothetical protein